MDNNIIKEILRSNLEHPKEKELNTLIIHKVELENKKQKSILFDEKSIVYLLLIAIVFSLSLLAIQESNPDYTALIIGSIISATPLLLLIYNKIHSLKNTKS